jgi:hypothetical protein
MPLIVVGKKIGGRKGRTESDKEEKLELTKRTGWNWSLLETHRQIGRKKGDRPTGYTYENVGRGYPFDYPDRSIPPL